MIYVGIDVAKDKGHYGKDMAVSIRKAAASSIGSVLPAKSLELKHTIHLIEVLSAEIDEIEAAINAIMATLNSPIRSWPMLVFHHPHINQDN